MDVASHYLEDALLSFRKQRKLAEEALEQVSDEQFFHAVDPESNSLALIVKHVAGNQRSRWRDFLSSDGEKPDRRRDTEFELAGDDDRAALMARWHEGWDLVLSTIAALRPDDLLRTVTIRGEPHSVLEAIDRQLVHYAHHAGQIVFLAKHLAGPRWRTLSIARGRSSEHEVAKDGSRYRVEPQR
jgi:hypothetical protein